MSADLSIDYYRGADGREAMLRVGPAGAPTVVVAPPLFEEANRTRALIVATLRALAARGIAGALPDLPGQGESERDLTGLRLGAWRSAFARAVDGIGPGARIVAVRGGALLDGDAKATGRLHIAPVAGKALVRDLLRARRAAALVAGETPPADDLAAEGPPLLLAGNWVGRELLRDLAAAEPGAADLVLDPFADAPRFRPPWLATEPVVDPALVATLARGIASWAAACAA